VPSTIRKRRHIKKADWYRQHAVNPELADRLNLFERWREDVFETSRPTAIEQRCKSLLPGRILVGDLYSQLNRAYGIEVRDPTGDRRVLEYSLSVPDEVFIDPKTGTRRWLIRAAMEGRLPDSVRLIRHRGLQAADIVRRLRETSEDVEAALDEISQGPAANVVNLATMRAAWQVAQNEETPRAYREAVVVLTRGIMAGLFVNGCRNAGR
jgi:asparagine synthase (glutamine-hydrolysing)